MGEVTPHLIRAGSSRFRPPELLREHHLTNEFDSGRLILDDWLRKKALGNDSARTFVATSGTLVVAYYSLVTGAIIRRQLPTAKLRRNLPDPVPMVIIGRLAVDRHYQKQGLGKALLKDAILRAINISQDIGFRGILVHALDDEAATFYQKYGFLLCQLDPRTLVLPMETAMQALL